MQKDAVDKIDQLLSSTETVDPSDPLQSERSTPVYFEFDSDCYKIATKEESLH
jgi:hypothetical protein